LSFNVGGREKDKEWRVREEEGRRELDQLLFFYLKKGGGRRKRRGGKGCLVGDHCGFPKTVVRRGEEGGGRLILQRGRGESEVLEVGGGRKEERFFPIRENSLHSGPGRKGKKRGREGTS